MRRSSSALLVLAAACTLGGVSQAQTAPPSQDALEALYWERQADARDRYVEADVVFMTGMVGHHAQALVMSAMAPTHGASPAVQRLASRIMNAQRDEIQTMQQWLVDRGHPAPEILPDGTTAMPAGAGRGGMDHGSMDHAAMDHDAMDHDAHMASGHDGGGDHAGMSHDDHAAMGHGEMMDHAGMPGMLSAAQLAELDAARGAEFDRLFLAYMIQHHGGALVMVDDLFAADGAAQEGATFKLASDIQVDQRTEIARMQQMLDAVSGSE